MHRLGAALNLLFFVACWAPACMQPEQNEVRLIYRNDRPAELSVPKTLLKDFKQKGMVNDLQVKLENNQAALLGDHINKRKAVIFKPLLPFSRGLRYQVYFRSRLVGDVRVPVDGTIKASAVRAVYPAADTLPENLLKCYIRFSAPMREGEALQHISLADENDKALPDIFLDLQPELWNEDRTVLTVWLDPGRIKRDLIPNQKLGNPLVNGKHYTLTIGGGWKNSRGVPLVASFSKKWLVGPRDSLSPRMNNWLMGLPAAGTKQPLTLTFDEPLDYFLIAESIFVNNDNDQPVEGVVTVSGKERIASFVPALPWSAGVYELVADPALEDLAGNNLARVFDRDLQKPPPAAPLTHITFTVKK